MKHIVPVAMVTLPRLSVSWQEISKVGRVAGIVPTMGGLRGGRRKQMVGESMLLISQC